MVVVLIIAVTLRLAAPAVQAAMSNRRDRESLHDTISTLRRARSESIAYGRAHLIRYDRSAVSGGGQMSIYRGVNGGCRTNDWTTLIAGPACGVPGSMCIDTVQTADSSSRSNQARIVIEETDYDFVDICYSSSGNMLWRTSAAGVFTDTPPSGNGFVFRIRHTDGQGGYTGMALSVLIPFGSIARVQR